MAQGSRLWIYLIVALVAASGLVVAGAWVFADAISVQISSSNADARKLRETIVTEGAKAALQLAVIVVLGGVAKYLFDQLQAERLRRDAARSVQKDFLVRLREIQAEVRRIRQELRGQQDAETYRAQVLALNETRDKLSGLEQDLIVCDALVRGGGEAVSRKLVGPQRFLDDIINEWTIQYNAVNRIAQSSRDANDVVEHLHQNCPMLQDLRQAPENGSYSTAFLTGTGEAARTLLKGIVADTPGGRARVGYPKLVKGAGPQATVNGVRDMDSGPAPALARAVPAQAMAAEGVGLTG